MSVSEMEGRKPSHQSPGAPQQKEGQYKLGAGYIGALQEAKGLVEMAKERKAAVRANLQEVIGQDQAGSSSAAPRKSIFTSRVGSMLEPSLPSWTSSPFLRRILMWSARAVIIALLVWQWRALSRELNSEAQAPIDAEDVLTPLAETAPDYENARNYARYIANRFASGGIAATSEKWVEGIPPASFDEAKPLLELLGTDFAFGKTSVDKTIIYNVECLPASQPGRSVRMEIVRKRLPAGKLVFRLQRIY